MHIHSDRESNAREFSPQNLVTVLLSFRHRVGIRSQDHSIIVNPIDHGKALCGASTHNAPTSHVQTNGNIMPATVRMNTD